MTSQGLLPRVHVFILSFNRPEYIAKAVQSILAQDYTDFVVTVSDNSTTDAVEKVLTDIPSDKGFAYIRRRPSLSSMDHFNQILSEITSEFFILFHDDDIILPNALSELMSAFETHPEAAAVAGNAFILQDQTESTELFDPYLKARTVLDSPLDIAKHYLISAKGHVPFPAYLYRSQAVVGLQMNNKQGGKHFDVSFLTKLIQRGPIVWVPTPIMRYRRHSGNDSLKIDLRAILSLCRFMTRQLPKEQKALIEEFKLKHYLLWLNQCRKKIATPLGAFKMKPLRRAALSFALTHPKLILRSILKR